MAVTDMVNVLMLMVAQMKVIGVAILEVVLGQWYMCTFWGADTYMGNWLLNVRHGRGHFSSALFGNCYHGDWEEGEMYGHGVIEWKAGETMEGFWDGTLTSMQSRRGNDLCTEDGSVLYHNGNKFEGAFRMENNVTFAKHLK